MDPIQRRDFLRGLGGSLLAGGAAWSALGGLAPLRAQDAKVTPEIVQLRGEMEAVARWIETTSRDQILSAAVDALRKGLPYRQLLGGLFLAGIRNIKPRPVGFKFHAVMVIESAHQLGLDAAQPDRLLPVFWALDNFKASQEADVREGDWALGPVKESAVPSPGEARQRFAEAMEQWDEEAADAAVAGLYRAAGSSEVAEVLFRYGARDWQNIGHKIIFTAHSFRTLHTIGWEHAEPVLRSLVFGLLNGGKASATAESAAPYASNLELASSVRKDWMAGKADPAATTALLGTLRQAKPDEAAREAALALKNGVSPSSIWDAVSLAAGELLIRQPGIVALHAMTASNSLHYAYQAASQDSTRLLVLLQACSWLCLFREGVRQRSGLPEGNRIDQLDADTSAEPPSLEAVFQDLTKDRALASRRLLAHASRATSLTPLFDTVRRLVFVKGTDSHDYKYASALFEEVSKASPAVRPRLVAAAAYQLRGASDRDSPLTEKSRQALARLGS